ncbi:2-dehydro-3-deoxyphosphogluconate aldolase/4-hydroxy-2-oxoglutarate aldolase [Nitrospina gracilis 3/211]|uniref:2-dehydro-3-deoxyphosphogluconate aldolase/4-hydroxy-2-oxoglutarate aldolase n=1 Tax=Nitrospina gracilis (strain 3/211) TaxID=1266370 RepID=M1Z0W7_NITG3|nr:MULTISPECIES: bifunctional 4-hydroxy-2-oxoglutarate aldolase/2-dehydro-3-deoxy-phosphogluconate aldolase [Nitrospina]MCF8724455.1 2-dehydro-3-deoxyphosphogluconate aldolase/(4S)-4-hydroxy-2-oxoglutarate aldolase [Nitrospina sp. Nb-3]CCQ91614.1 2-dehydro-3-deoxyphosphogluconate aldolase/4-hydroxy-2-oxoglutarate aldolase [Nitrospina gracilis 3/211]
MSGTVFDPDRFARKPVLGIIRGVADNQLPGVLEAVVRSGVEFIEITLNTPGAVSLLKLADQEFSDRLCLGAGTVLTQPEAETALSAGARFLVSPTASADVARYCREQEIPHFPGAFTPTEIQSAWESGAFMVKVFPSSVLGPGYFREVKGPFDGIRLMAVGGVRASNVCEFFEKGASAVAVGASVFSAKRMAKGDHASIEKDLKEILFEVTGFLNKIDSGN